MFGKFYIVGTPIGNREDITLRALRVLAEVDIVLCEDTRVTGKLLGMYGEDSRFTIFNQLAGRQDSRKPELVRFDERTERGKISQVLQWLSEGKSVALVSDAGMPVISDPGYLLVKALREAEDKLGGEKLVIQVVPGPSALSAAVAVSGLPSNQILFLGFLPKKAGKRKKIWEELRGMREGTISPAVVIYESPYRLRKTVAEIGLELHDPDVSVCGELTKMHERVVWGKASEVLEKLPDSSVDSTNSLRAKSGGGKVKGEWVVLIGLGR